MTAKKRICFLKDLISVPTNGAEINAYRLIARLNADGFEASMKIFDPLPNPEYFVNYLKKAGFTILAFNADQLVYLINDIPIVVDRSINFDRNDLGQTDQIKNHILAHLDELKPDVIACTQTDYVAIEAALESKIPLISFLTDNEFIKPKDLGLHKHGAKIESLINQTKHYSALSKFLITSFQQHWGHTADLLYGLIPPKNYLVPQMSDKSIIGMVNTAAHKGFPLIALLAAVHPQENFAALINALPNQKQAQAFAEVQKELPNLSFEGPYPDPREFYKKLKVLLVPSIWEEGFGRVVVEAGLNGIPVMASNRGGLPEALNGGGFCIEAPFVDPTGQVSAQEIVQKNTGWFQAFELLKDPQRYQQESERMKAASFDMVQKIDASYLNFTTYLESL